MKACFVTLRVRRTSLVICKPDRTCTELMNAASLMILMKPHLRNMKTALGLIISCSGKFVWSKSKYCEVELRERIRRRVRETATQRKSREELSMIDHQRLCREEIIIAQPTSMT